MRIKILMFGDDPVSVMADAQILRERDMLVYTAFNLSNINEIINEVQPDLLFFNPQLQSAGIVDAYNELVNDIYHTRIPVVYTLTEDDVYLVTRKRTETKMKRNLIADNMIGAVKMAMRSNKTYEKKFDKKPALDITVPAINISA